MPLFDNEITVDEVKGLQTALDQKAPLLHQHLPSAWENLVLSPNWRNFGTGFATPQCRKVIGSLVEVKGIIRKTTNTVGDEILTTLPLGYRPTEMIYVITWSGASTTMSRLLIEPSGAIKFVSGNGGGVALNFFFGLD